MLTLKTKDFIPEGYEIDETKSTLQEIIFKKIEKKLITSWEELESKQGYFINIYGCIYPRCLQEYKTTYPTKEQAEAGLLLPQLLQVRDYLRDGWRPSKGVESWRVNAKLQVWKGKNLEGLGISIFTFPTKELAEHFAKHFKEDLIKFYTNLQ